MITVVSVMLNLKFLITNKRLKTEQTYRREVVNKRHHTLQGQPIAKPETPHV